MREARRGILPWGNAISGDLGTHLADFYKKNNIHMIKIRVERFLLEICIHIYRCFNPTTNDRNLDHGSGNIKGIKVTNLLNEFVVQILLELLPDA